MRSKFTLQGSRWKPNFVVGGLYSWRRFSSSNLSFRMKKKENNSEKLAARTSASSKTSTEERCYSRGYVGMMEMRRLGNSSWDEKSNEAGMGELKQMTMSSTHSFILVV